MGRHFGRFFKFASNLLAFDFKRKLLVELKIVLVKNIYHG